MVSDVSNRCRISSINRIIAALCLTCVTMLKNAHLRKSKRIEGRRFLTIGYDGEVRSPLRDRKNTPSIATVQRSKSAQTPSNKNKLHLNKKNRDEKEINQKEWRWKRNELWNYSDDPIIATRRNHHRGVAIWGSWWSTAKALAEVQSKITCHASQTIQWSILQTRQKPEEFE